MPEVIYGFEITNIMFADNWVLQSLAAYLLVSGKASGISDMRAGRALLFVVCARNRRLVYQIQKPRKVSRSMKLEYIIASLTLSLVIIIILLFWPCKAKADDNRWLHFAVGAAGTYACTELVDAEEESYGVFGCSLALMSAGIAKEVYDHNTGGQASDTDLIYTAAGVTVGAALTYRW